MTSEIANGAVQSLLTLTDLPPADAADRITGLYADKPDRRTMRELDRALLQLLEDRLLGDPILKHIPLEMLDALAVRCLDRNLDSATGARGNTWALLDVIRRSTVLQRISQADTVDAWSDRILELVERSNFTFPASSPNGVPPTLRVSYSPCRG